MDKACSGIFNRQKQRKSNSKRKKSKWFDKSCDAAKRDLIATAKLLNKTPNDTQLKINYYTKKKKFKKLVKIKKSQFWQNNLNKLSNLHANKSQDMWKLIKSLKNSDKNKNTEDCISASAWMEFYKSSCSIERDRYNDFQQQIIDSLTSEENKNQVNQLLDKSITAKEVVAAIKNLKSKKAAGIDGFCIELLKHGSSFLCKSLVKLFNAVLDTSNFPDVWNTSIMTHLFKKGDKYDPKNYRGISVGSCVGKVFSHILNERLNSFLEDNHIIHNNQAGFRKNHRTVDHIFTMKTIVDKYINKRQNIYVCFVDFAKAFDSVWRIGLFHKLLKNNINGKVYRLIKNMYTNTKLHIKSNNFVSPSLKVEKGVKQGCVLSPTLFNLFVNDLKTNLDKVNTEPPMLNNTPVNSLFYADDLVLMSTSKEGLQRALNTLHTFCSNWKLDVNLKKTQAMKFSKSPLIENHLFNFGNTCIKSVKSYTYLGLTIRSNGSFSETITNLADKAGKSLHSLRGILLHNNKIKLPLHLFNVFIKPVLLYGSEIWGQDFMDYKKWDKSPIEKMHLKFCKYLLQCNRQACNTAVRGELGQFPLLLDVKLNIVKYWLHIVQLPHNNLAKEAFMEQMKNNWSWFNCLSAVTKENGINFPLDKAPSLKHQAVITGLMKTNQMKKYEVYWKNLVTDENSKLRMYAKIKHHFRLEPYLTQLQGDKRKLLTKLRISNHDLAIEKGRHTIPKTPITERYCNQCNSDNIEDEMHFLLVCQKYKIQRNDFLSKINLPNDTIENQLIYILTKQELSFNEQLADYICTIYRQRNT